MCYFYRKGKGEGVDEKVKNMKIWDVKRRKK